MSAFVMNHAWEQEERGHPVRLIRRLRKQSLSARFDELADRMSALRTHSDDSTTCCQFSTGRRARSLPQMYRQSITGSKAALKRPHSKGWRAEPDASYLAKRLDCGRFSAAFSSARLCARSLVVISRCSRAHQGPASCKLAARWPHVAEISKVAGAIAPCPPPENVVN